MKPLPWVLIAIGGAVACGSCASPASQLSPRQAPAWQDTGTPMPAVALKREVRYYTDESGAVWDDRGRKLGAKP